MIKSHEAIVGRIGKAQTIQGNKGENIEKVRAIWTCWAYEERRTRAKTFRDEMVQ